MAESELSSEVNAKTVLPAPTIGDPSVDSNGNVVVSWTNNDDSSDGGIDVGRFSDEPFTDSFEAQNLSGFAGETGQFSTTTAVSFDGSTAVEKTTDGNYAGIYVDDSIADPSKAQTATAYYYNSSGRGGVYLADSADGSGYSAYLAVNTLFIQKIADSATLEANLASVSGETLSVDTWYRIIITHDGVDNITARVENSNGTTVIGPISVTDADYQPDTVGVWAYSVSSTLDLFSIDSQSKQFTTVASSLSPSTDSYTDSSVSSGETYEYRIERNTDHATATSATAQATTAARIQTLTTSSSDLETASASPTRIQTLTTSSSDLETTSASPTRIQTLTTASSDLETASASPTRIQTLTTASSDRGTATATTRRFRTLATTATDTDTQSTSVLFSAFANNRLSAAPTDLGTVAVSPQRVQQLSLTPTDTDVTASTLARTRHVSLSLTDTDTTVSTPERTLLVTATTTDRDTTTTGLARARTVAVTATDTDTATSSFTRVQLLTLDATDTDTQSTSVLFSPVSGNILSVTPMDTGIVAASPLRVQSVGGATADTESAVAATTRLSVPLSTPSDTGRVTASPTRTQTFTTAATDIDATTATLSRVTQPRLNVVDTGAVTASPTRTQTLTGTAVDTAVVVGEALYVPADAFDATHVYAVIGSFETTHETVGSFETTYNVDGDTTG